MKCTCKDLVNNGDHYCPIHGTFAKPIHKPEPTEAAPSTDCVKDFGGYTMGTYKGKLYAEPEREALVGGQPQKGGTYLNCPFTNCKSVSDCKLNGYCCSSITKPQPETLRPEMEKATQQIGDIVTQIIGDWPMEVPVLRRPIITRIVQQALRLAAASGTESAPAKYKFPRSAELLDLLENEPDRAAKIESLNLVFSSMAISLDESYPASSLTQAGLPREVQADTLFGIYCDGNPNNTPWMSVAMSHNKERFWQAFQRIADYVNRAAQSQKGGEVDGK